MVQGEHRLPLPLTSGVTGKWIKRVGEMTREDSWAEAGVAGSHHSHS